MQRPRLKRKEFTLVELLVVISIIMILAGLLLTTLGKSKDQAKAKSCIANLKNIGVAMICYQNDNRECVVPSYNMSGYVYTKADGWGPILDRDKYVSAPADKAENNVFYCPSTHDLNGWANGNDGPGGLKDGTLHNAEGWCPWPFAMASPGNVATTIPENGFNKTIRVSYWINASNPTGPTSTKDTQDIYFTGSVGWTGTCTGTTPSSPMTIVPTKISAFKQASRLVALADGIYAGRQNRAVYGMQYRRVGFRHPGGTNFSTNILCADGHTDNLKSGEFPMPPGAPKNNDGTGTLSNAEILKLNERYTCYADPDTKLAPLK